MGRRIGRLSTIILDHRNPLIARSLRLVLPLSRARPASPAYWAKTQNNLGAALGVLGQRGDDEALRRAVAAHEAALNVMLDFRATAYVAMIERSPALAHSFRSLFSVNIERIMNFRES
jgi:hypothetical protein